MPVSAVNDALAVQARLMEQLLAAAVQQAVEPAVDAALLALQLQAASLVPEGVGAHLDVYA